MENSEPWEKLDVFKTVKNGQLETDLYCKKTNTHRY